MGKSYKSGTTGVGKWPRGAGGRACGAWIRCHPGVSDERPSLGHGREWLSPSHESRALGERLEAGESQSVMVRKPHVGATRVGEEPALPEWVRGPHRAERWRAVPRESQFLLREAGENPASGGLALLPTLSFPCLGGGRGGGGSRAKPGARRGRSGSRPP